MISLKILNIVLLLLQFPCDSTKDFHKHLESYIGRFLAPPPESDSAGKCYHYTELVIVEIGSNGNLKSVSLSDSAPAWLQLEFDKLKKRQSAGFEKLNELSKRAGFKKGFLLFTLIIESDDFPCGSTLKKRTLPDDFFKFNRKNLKGNISFCEPLKFIWPTRYLKKENN